MTPPTREPDARASTKRRGRTSAEKSTGLDYTSCHRIDEDIQSRIRSLLLSRNVRRPPRTPNPSEDEHSKTNDILDEEVVSQFDFSSAKSVGQSALQQAEDQNLFLGSNRRVMTDGSNMDDEPAHEAHLPLTHFKAQFALRRTSSANDIPAVADAKEPDPRAEPEATTFFGLPKLVLKDIEVPDYEPVPSCGLDYVVLPSVPLPNIPVPSVPPIPKIPVPNITLPTLPSLTTKTKEEPERQRVRSCTPHQPCPKCAQAHECGGQIDIRSVAKDIAKDVAKLGLLIQGVQSHDSDIPEKKEPVASESDASTQSKKSTASLSHKPQTASLLSGASRSSSKHALLKSSISPSTPIDTGLPIPPILTPVAAKSTTETEDYWGVNPEVKVTIQDAVQDAVKKALHEMLAPSGPPPPPPSKPKETEKEDKKPIPPPKRVPTRDSSKETKPDKKKVSTDDLVAERRLSTEGDPDADEHKSVSSANSSDMKTGLKKAVPWLKGLVHHETKFTELPPRKHRDSKGHGKPQVPEDTPAIEVSKPVVDIEESEPDMFAKTIEDLENLLSEAMFIARQAADGDEYSYVPELLGSAAAVLKDGRLEFQDEESVREASKARILSMAYAGMKPEPSSDASDAESMHESLKNYGGSSDDGDEDHDDHVRNQQKIPEISVNKPGSGISVKTVMTRTVSAAKPSKTLVPPVVPESQRKKSAIVIQEPASGLLDVDPFIETGTLRKGSTTKLSPTQPSRAPTGLKAETVEKDLEEDKPKTKSTSSSLPQALITPPGYKFAEVVSRRQSKYDQRLVKNKLEEDKVPSKKEIREDIESLDPPSIEPRMSSLRLKKGAPKDKVKPAPVRASDTVSTPITTTTEGYKVSSCSQSFDGSEVVDLDSEDAEKQEDPVSMSGGRSGWDAETEMKNDADSEQDKQPKSKRHMFNLDNKRHISLKGEHHKGFSLTRSQKKPLIARDWAPARKRFVATVACISTSLVGVLTGIYAAEVPAIQYYVVDFHHYVILGNVFFFVGLAISTFFFWPLPLLHGRKPYILGSMCLAMPLLFPQALAVGQFRSPYDAKWRVALLLPRAIMGFTLGFANMNFKAILTDIFGASLQSSNPHQEVVDVYDVRRHGGGLGLWLGIWTWCNIGSGGVGFLIGAGIINSANPAWGFYISICIIAGVLLLNVICPEVRRSAFRKSVAEVKDGEDQGTRRLARGEVKMHMVQSGPKWWGEEFHYGIKLSGRMLRQPGFLILALYVAWIYGQVVMLVVLLGSLTSKYYKFQSPYIGASVAAIPIGALLSLPFQKAGLFSRDRTHAATTDDDTRDKKVGMSSHLIRRAIFVLCLPFAGLGYTLSSNGPPIPWILPILFAGIIGFLSNLGLSECHGIIMETFDISDLQPGMTGRPRKSKEDQFANKRTNYSSFPRVSAAFAITQSLGYLIAAAATGVGGVAQRHLGQQAATGVVAGILLILSILLLGVLVRFREVQIIPNMHKEELEAYMSARRRSAKFRGEEVDDEDLRPTIIGNPTHVTRRMCILELGSLTRWTEIRNKNHLVDQNSLEAEHPNIAAIRHLEKRIKRKESEIAESIRKMSKEDGWKGRRSQQAQMNSYELDEGGDTGGHRHMSGKGRQSRSKKKKTESTQKEGKQ